MLRTVTMHVTYTRLNLTPLPVTHSLLNAAGAGGIAAGFLFLFFLSLSLYLSLFFFFIFTKSSLTQSAGPAAWSCLQSPPPFIRRRRRFSLTAAASSFSSLFYLSLVWLSLPEPLKKNFWEIIYLWIWRDLHILPQYYFGKFTVFNWFADF